MIGYLGPEGTFSHMAATQYAGTKDKTTAYPSIHKLIKAVNDGETDSCLVPIENSIEGGVNQTLDALAFNSDLYITGELTVTISENLIAKGGTKISDIKKIISHPQPIGQCAAMIAQYFPDALIEYTDSTAAAAKRICEYSTNDAAMIGPKTCAELYGLKILMSDCQEEKNNQTRFVELKKTPCTYVGDNDKTSFIFAADDKPGSLIKALSAFSENNVNMIKIESRPVKTQIGQYIFFIDADGNIQNENVKKAWDKIKTVSGMHKLLGSYAKG